MKTLVGVFASLFGFIVCFFLIVMICRLSIGKLGFVSFSQVYHAVSDIDLLRSFNKLVEDFSSCIGSFSNSINDFGTISDIGSFFQVLGNFIPNLFRLLVSPLSIIYYLGWFIYDLWTAPMFLINSLLV